MAMNLSLNKLPWYSQVGVFVLLSASALGVFWYFYAQPVRATLDNRQAELVSLQKEIVRGHATERRLPEFRAEVVKLEAQLDHLRAVLPEEQDVADLLRRVQGMATQSNLTIRGFTPHAVAKKAMHMEWPIGLKLEGRYHDIGAFLDRVGKFPRIINVNDIKIKTLDKATGGATVSAECTATTFVLIDKKVTPAPGAGATPGRAAAN
jgi:type IV pilus assembly protein PilO